MMDFLSIVWTIISFILGVVWTIAWFVLRDLLSTLLWLAIAVWLAFVLRYRSFAAGTMAVLRYVRHGVSFLWRWVRGKPTGGLPRPATVTKVVKEYRRHVPLGHVSLSEEMNALLVALLLILAST
jgi:hypothetical protein